MKVYEKFNEFEINGIKPFFHKSKVDIHDMLIINLFCNDCPKLNECKEKLSTTNIKPRSLCQLLLLEWLSEDVLEEEDTLNGDK